MSSAPANSALSSRRRPDWWIYVTGLLLTLQIVFFIVPHLAPGKAGFACWMFGSDRLLWWMVGTALMLVAIIWSLWRRPIWRRWRLAGLGAIVLLGLSPAAFQVYPSSYDDRPSEIPFRLPLDGPITVGWGGSTPAVNYHVVAADQRWAYDLLVTRDGKTHRGEGLTCEEYYCYGLPVLASADGVVEAVFDGEADAPVGVLGGFTLAGGNQVVLRVAPGQFLFLCHLKRGSLTVKQGDSVAAGQTLGLVGNSGNTSEPHLHIHLQDSPQPHLGEGIPLYFHNYRADGQLIPRGIPTGGVSKAGFTGQIVEHAGPD